VDHHLGFAFFLERCALLLIFVVIALILNNLNLADVLYRWLIDALRFDKWWRVGHVAKLQLIHEALARCNHERVES